MQASFFNQAVTCALFAVAAFWANVLVSAEPISEPVFERNAKPKLVLESGAGEGPAWHPGHGVFFSGPDGITLLDLEGNAKQFLPDAGSNGLLFDHQGRLLVCQPMYRRVSRLDVNSGKLEVLSDQYEGKKYNQPNAARKLWRFDLMSDGSVNPSTRKLIYDWKTGRGPDGLSIDQKGRLYVAGGRNEARLPNETATEFKAGVYVLSPDGDLLQFVPIPRDEVTNCTFGGTDLRTLYITAGGTLWSIRTESAGKMPWPK